MQRPSGTAAVRLSLWTLIVASFAMAIAPPVHGGTEAAPEIADPANDQAVGGAAPGCVPGVVCNFSSGDIILAWVDGETATDLILKFKVTSADPNGGSAQGTPTTRYQYDWTLIVADTTYVASVQLTFSKVLTPMGVASAATLEESTFTLTVPKANIGNPTAGTSATGMFILSRVIAPPFPGNLATDRAPNAGAGQDYTFTAGGGGPGPCPNCTADDTDGDGLNDTWEQQYFGNLTQNATGDPDGDGLTNGQEEALGTDPTDPDTDGDGTNDKDDPFPTDPTRGGSSSSGTSSTSSTSTSTRSSSSSSGTRTSGTTTTGGVQQGGDDEGDVESVGDAVEKLRSDPGYLGLSGGGFLAVLVLCIIALAVRWSL